jgi:hypothetical protein
MNKKRKVSKKGKGKLNSKVLWHQRVLNQFNPNHKNRQEMVSTMSKVNGPYDLRKIQYWATCEARRMDANPRPRSMPSLR